MKNPFQLLPVVTGYLLIDPATGAGAYKISADQTAIGALTKYEVVGDLLYATIYGYLVLNDAQDQIQSRAAGVINYRLPSYGVFQGSCRFF